MRRVEALYGLESWTGYASYGLTKRSSQPLTRIPLKHRLNAVGLVSFLPVPKWSDFEDRHGNCIFLQSPNVKTNNVYEVCPRKDKRGVDLISDALPFGRLWYGEPNAVANAIGYAEHCSRSHDTVIGVYDADGNVIETHQHKGRFTVW